MLILTSSLRPCRVKNGAITRAQTQECMTQQREGRADLAPSSLDHELSGQVGGWLWLQRSDHDAFIQRITRNDLKEDTYSRTIQETGECFAVQDNLDHVNSGFDKSNTA